MCRTARLLRALPRRRLVSGLVRGLGADSTGARPEELRLEHRLPAQQLLDLAVKPLLADFTPHLLERDGDALLKLDYVVAEFRLDRLADLVLLQRVGRL